MKSLRIPLASRPLISISLLMALSLLVAIALSACGRGQVDIYTPTPRPTLTLTPTFVPTRTPTPLPPGGPDNPFVIGLVSAIEDPQMVVAADELPRRISDLTGLAAVGKIHPSYQSLLQDMEAGRVHVAFLPPLTYLYASSRGVAEVALLTNHLGVYQYGTQFLANTASGIQPQFDPISEHNAVDAPTALEQLDGLRPCWVEPLSPSGYIAPAGLLLLNEIETATPVFIQSHTAVVRAIYVQGICDYGATFATSGDPRTSAAVQDDLRDVMNRVLVIWRSDPIIPNTNISYLTGLSESSRLALNRALLEIVKSPDGKALLTVSAGNYEIADLRAAEDNLYDPLRDMVGAVRINLLEAIGR